MNNYKPFQVSIKKSYSDSEARAVKKIASSRFVLYRCVFSRNLWTKDGDYCYSDMDYTLRWALNPWDASSFLKQLNLQFFSLYFQILLIWTT